MTSGIGESSYVIIKDFQKCGSSTQNSLKIQNRRIFKPKQFLNSEGEEEKVY